MTRVNSVATSSSSVTFIPPIPPPPSVATSAPTARPSQEQPLIKTLLSNRFQQNIQRAVTGDASVTSQEEEEVNSQDDDLNSTFTSVETDSATEADTPVLENGVHALLQKPVPSLTSAVVPNKQVVIRAVNGVVPEQNGFATNADAEQTLNGSHVRAPPVTDNLNCNNNNNQDANLMNMDDDTDDADDDDAPADAVTTSAGATSANAVLSETIAVFQSAMTDIHEQASTSQEADTASISYNHASTSQQSESVAAVTQQQTPDAAQAMLQQTSSSLSAFVQPQPSNLPISNPGVQTFDHNPVPTLLGASSQTAVASQPLVTSFQQPQLPPSAVTTQTIPNVIPQPPQQQQQQQQPGAANQNAAAGAPPQQNAGGQAAGGNASAAANTQ